MQDLKTVFKRLRYRVVGKIPTTVSYFEMLQSPQKLLAPEIPPDARLLRVKNMSVDYLRFLYDQVGAGWQWTARKLKSDEELLKIIHDPATEFYVLHVEGNPAGYLELQQTGNEIEIALFGLVPKYFGQGLGKFLLDWAVYFAWKEKKIQRLWFHTCTLDAPQAIPNYQRAGFKKFTEKSDTVDRIEACWE